MLNYHKQIIMVIILVFLALTTTSCGTSAVTPSGITPTVQCAPKYAYGNLFDKGQSWVVTSQQQDQNNSESPAQVTFTSTTSKTVTVTDQLNLTTTLHAEADILIATITADVKAEINVSVTQTVNATIGNAYNFLVPPGKTAYANYGVKVQVTNGHLYDKAGCEGNKSDLGMDITYVPIASGWCVWTSDQPACPSVSTPIQQKTPTVSAVQETLTVPFSSGRTGVTTANTYTGTVTIRISGTGQATPKHMSDAFCTYTDQANISTYQRDNSGGVLFINDDIVEDFILGKIPDCRSDHNYEFKIKASEGRLTFGIGDDKPEGNTGSYQITIIQE